MGEGYQWRTSASLLGRLNRNPSDPEAWDEFVNRYGLRVYQWCRGWGLQDADAEDVTQNVLLAIAKQIQDFRYDPSRSFRAWLKTITRRAWSRFVTTSAHRVRSGGDVANLEQLASVEARESLERQLEEQFDADLLEEASVRVRLRLEPKTWEAFRLVVYEQLSGAEAAAQLEMRVGSVYMAKNRVQKLLAEEIRWLENDGQS